MKSVFTALMSLLVLMNVSFADCSAAYKDEIKSLEGKMNPPRTTVIANVVGEGALVGSLAVLTGTVAPAAVLALPVAAVGAGTYLGILVAKRNGLRNAMHVIRDAKKGSGPELERFLKVLGRRSKADFDKEDVIKYLVQQDYENAFCTQNPRTDKYKLITFQQMVKMTKNNL